MKKIRSYGHLSVYSPDGEYLGFSFRADFAALMVLRLGKGATIRIPNPKSSVARIVYIVGEILSDKETESAIMQCIDDRIWEIKVEQSKPDPLQHVRNLAERFKSQENGKDIFDSCTHRSIISAQMCDWIWNEAAGGAQ